jgi:hypothetical protein
VLEAPPPCKIFSPSNLRSLLLRTQQAKSQIANPAKLIHALENKKVSQTIFRFRV